jgi:hypothetical protein
MNDECPHGVIIQASGVSMGAQDCKCCSNPMLFGVNNGLCEECGGPKSFTEAYEFPQNENDDDWWHRLWQTYIKAEQKYK